MSAVTVEAKDLHNCFSALALISPKGDTEFPVHVTLTGTELRFQCLLGCAFEGTIPASSQDLQNKTILWYNVVPLLPTAGQVLLEFTESYLRLVTDDVECTFTTGYSDVTDFDLTKYHYSSIQSNSYADGLRNIQSLGLEKLYGKSLPVAVYESVSVVKYPCTYVQVRTTGLPFTASIDQEHMRMLLRFKPEEVAVDDKSGSLVVKRGNVMLQIPCKLGIEANDFSSYMSSLQVVCRLGLDGFADRLMSASRVSNRADCRVTLYANGMQVAINMGVATSTLNVGNVRDNVVQAFTFPIQVLLAFFKTIGDGVVEILVGGELLCLRTQTLIILTRVLH